jgi:hypothetical protein
LEHDLVPAIAIQIDRDWHGDKARRFSEFSFGDDSSFGIDRQHFPRSEIAQADFVRGGGQQIQSMTRTGKFPFTAESAPLIKNRAAELVFEASGPAFFGEEKFSFRRGPGTS